MLTRLIALFRRLSFFFVLLFGLLDSNSCRQRNTDSCFAGSHRLASTDITKDALKFLQEENEQRANYYLTMADTFIEDAVWALENDGGIDPLEAAWSASLQIHAAVQLAPTDAKVYFEAAKLSYKTSWIQELELGYYHSLSFFVEAITLDESYFEPFKTFLTNGPKAKGSMYTCDFDRMIYDDFECIDWLEFFTNELKQNGGWDDISKLPTKRFGKIFKDRGVCKEGEEICTADELVKPRANIQLTNPENSAISALRNEFKRQTLFETYIITANIKDSVGKEFLNTISQLAIDRFGAFAKEVLSDDSGSSYENINNEFFMHLTEQDGWNRNWPEMVNNKIAWPTLRDVTDFALHEYVRQVGVDVSDHELSTDMWAAVYVGHAKRGLRHFWHTHAQNIASCVLYSHSDGTLPIIFADPRGLHPLQDFEQYPGDYDLEPLAPFHHSYTLFPKTGDIICFPSWLVHRVPRAPPGTRRVAFPSNLRTEEFAEAWYSTATL